MINYINGTKEKIHTVISNDAEKEFDKLINLSCPHMRPLFKFSLHSEATAQSTHLQNIWM